MNFQSETCIFVIDLFNPAQGEIWQGRVAELADALDLGSSS